MGRTKFNSEDHLYIQVAEGIEKMIGEEVLKIGDKLPSVRVLSEEYGISMGTAFQAYYHLEGKGLIESRPKSGYYVRFNHRRFRELPKSIPTRPDDEDITVQQMIFQLHKISHSKDEANFALASPAVSLLPSARLSKSVVHALRNNKDACVEYADFQGNIDLRKQIARLSFNWGGKVTPDEVLITSGAMEAVVICLRSVTQPGDMVAVECPSYFGIYQVMESMGLKLIEISSDTQTGLSLEELATAMEQHPIKACLVIPNFSNPSGSSMPDHRKQQLVQMLTKADIPLIEDDIYGELYFGRQRPKPCKYFDTKGIVMHCSSFSKSLAPGYRLGWVLPGKYFEKTQANKMMHTVSTATLTQAAVAHFLSIGRYEYHLKNLRKALHTQCLRYTQAILQYFPPDSRVSRPEGGFVLWVELNKKVNSYQLCLEAMKYQIALAPGRIFSNSFNYSNYLRIGYGTPWDESADKALKLVGGLIKKMIQSAPD